MAIRIRFKCGISGLSKDHGGSYSYRPGQAVVWPDDAEARRFIDGGIAELVTDVPAAPVQRTAVQPTKPERAELPPPEPPASKPPSVVPPDTHSPPADAPKTNAALPEKPKGRGKKNA